jgi:hypothetical protein
MTARKGLKPDAIVPEALQRRVGWKAQHQALAEKIIDQFNLKLPRDRELIRQLAFVRVQQHPRNKEEAPNDNLTGDPDHHRTHA